jgi:hypothetical protein
MTTVPNRWLGHLECMGRLPRLNGSKDGYMEGPKFPHLLSRQREQFSLYHPNQIRARHFSSSSSSSSSFWCFSVSLFPHCCFFLALLPFCVFLFYFWSVRRKYGVRWRSWQIMTVANSHIKHISKSRSLEVSKSRNLEISKCNQWFSKSIWQKQSK